MSEEASIRYELSKLIDQWQMMADSYDDDARRAMSAMDQAKFLDRCAKRDTLRRAMNDLIELLLEEEPDRIEDPEALSHLNEGDVIRDNIGNVFECWTGIVGKYWYQTGDENWVFTEKDIFYPAYVIFRNHL